MSIKISLLFNYYAIFNYNFMKNIFLNLLVFIIAIFFLSNISIASADDVNLIPNSNLETWTWWIPTDWAKGNWWKNISKFIYPTLWYNSRNAANITVSGFTNWDAKWFFNDVPVTAGQTYTFSDMYDATTNTSLTVRYKLSDWTYSYWYLGAAPKTVWFQKFTADFTAPANAVSATVFHVINSVWYLTIDDASLTLKQVLVTPPPVVEVPTPSTDWNLVLNSTLEAANWNIPTNWLKWTWWTNVSTFTYPVVWFNSNKASKIDVTSYTNWDAKWFFEEVPVSGWKIYTFTDMYTSNVNTYITARFKLWDGTYKYSYLWMAPSSTWWKEFSSDITIPLNTVTLTVFHVINSVWSLTIDNVSVKEKVIVVPTPNTDWNLVLNSNLETWNDTSPLYWSKWGWWNNVSNYSYSTNWYNNSKSAKVDVTSYTDWDSKWFFDEVAVVSWKTYEFSDMYDSNVATSITARYTLTNGSYQYAYIWSVPSNIWWKKYTTKITIPQNVVWLTVFHVISTVWYLNIDDVKLTPAPDDIFTEGMITFSFDDGYKNIYDRAIPILDAAGIKSTQAIFTDSYNYVGYMSKEQIKSLYDNWHEIASHTITHANLNQITLSWARNEIIESKADLAEYWINASTFVYPYWEYNDTTIEILKEAWYIWARSVTRWYNRPSTDRFQLMDQELTSVVTFDTVKWYIDTAIAEKKWLILEMHDQWDNLWFYSNTTELLQQIVDYVKSKNMKTVTLGEWISKLNNN